MEAISEMQFKSFHDFIDSHDEFIIAGHKEPDGDCLTSSLGMARILKHLKKTYQLVNSGPFKRTEIKKFAKYFSNEIKAETGKNCSVGLILLDCSEYHRLGDIGNYLSGFDTFIIDHHQTASADPKKSIIVPAAPATAYLIQLIYENFLGSLDKKTAEILLLGMCTDTGFFKFLDENSKDVFLAASRLVASGANPRNVFNQISNGKPYSTRKLLAKLLDRSKTEFRGKLIWTYETLEDSQKYSKDGRDSDSLYQLLLSVDNVRAVFFIRQDTEEKCTVGFRSQDGIDVSKVAQVFGGGGHKCAAGLSTEGTIEELVPKILSEFEKIF